MVAECQANDSFIICHDTIDFEAQEEGVPGRDEAACRGYVDAYGGGQMHRIMGRLNMIEEV
jgi:hypothetical protein